ncbi:MAG: YggS family pyridoxal phosphate-dependent enzyme [Bacteroidetes bacterium]|jgi:pyridoxal phosphate enzyme, YggS family|nr:YggS family pyridoxal phosphate-dependent enzyme [Bacteroidota bacterium]MDA0950143.1 YggS family pyridoxal phosphate-dependent enzyme [Bacteroidota bacterium]
MSVALNLSTIKNMLPEEIELIAVSKTKPNSLILEAYEAGQKDFGENKVQEMAAKHDDLPKDIRWHMIGHLQRNKVKYLIHFVHLIHSVDSKRLLDEIQKQAHKIDRKVAVLLQIHIAKEDTKFGLDEQELDAILKEKSTYSHISFKGLMGMATFTTDTHQIDTEFAYLKSLYDRIQSRLDQPAHLSAGMSADYPLALNHGTTMIRIGSAIFGHR